MNTSTSYKKQLSNEILKKLADKSANKNSDFDYKTIKTFDDACRKIKHSGSIPLVSVIPEKFRKQVIAYYKLMVIYEAINDGWDPDLTNENQYKFYPRFEVISLEESLFNVGYSSINTKTGNCSMLYTNRSEKALFIAENFKDIYIDYLFLSK